MKKVLIIILINIYALAFQNLEASIKNIKLLQTKNIPIVDIRTPIEWKQTGTIPGAIKDTFFLDNGEINPNFLKTLKQHHINKKFAIICRTGHRSKIAAQILSKYGFEVISLEGGMFRLFKDLLKNIN